MIVAGLMTAASPRLVVMTDLVHAQIRPAEIPSGPHLSGSPLRPCIPTGQHPVRLIRFNPPILGVTIVLAVIGATPVDHSLVVTMNPGPCLSGSPPRPYIPTGQHPVRLVNSNLPIGIIESTKAENGLLAEIAATTLPNFNEQAKGAKEVKEAKETEAKEAKGAVAVGDDEARHTYTHRRTHAHTYAHMHTESHQSLIFLSVVCVYFLVYDIFSCAFKSALTIL
jgi:hypothetical protein